MFSHSKMYACLLILTSHCCVPGLASAEAQFPEIVQSPAALSGLARVGWTVEYLTEGDLNKDQENDVVAVLRKAYRAPTQTGDNTDVEQFDPHRRVLLIYFPGHRERELRAEGSEPFADSDA